MDRNQRAQKSSSPFYKWGERDTEQISAREAREGDEIALIGGNLLYGFIPINRVGISSVILLQYVLPIGAILSSSANTTISVFWEGNLPLIQVSQRVNFNDPLVIRKRVS